MRALILALSLAVLPQLAHAGGFPTMERFNGMSEREMAKLPDVRVRLGHRLNHSDIAGKSRLELSLMKNSIFAQVGYPFKNAAYNNYFQSRSWYHGLRYEPSKLTGVDKDNSQLLSDAAAKAKDSSDDGDDDGGYYYNNGDDDDGGYNSGYKN